MINCCMVLEFGLFCYKSPVVYTMVLTVFYVECVTRNSVRLGMKVNSNTENHDFMLRLTCCMKLKPFSVQTCRRVQKHKQTFRVEL